MFLIASEQSIERGVALADRINGLNFFFTLVLGIVVFLATRYLKGYLGKTGKVQGDKT